MKNVDVPSFKINGETIQEVDNVKYLGHFICKWREKEMRETENAMGRVR